MLKALSDWQGEDQLLSKSKIDKKTYISRLVDFYFNRLIECQDDLELFLKEIIELQKVQEIDEYDNYHGEAVNTDKFERTCNKLKDIIETIANDLEKWISSIKSYRPSIIWSAEKLKSWKEEVLSQISFIEQNIDKDFLNIKPKIRAFRERILEGKRQLIYLIDLLELPVEFSMTKLSKFKSWAIGIAGFLLGVFIEKIVDLIIRAIHF